MSFVNEMYMVWDSMHTHPIDGSIIRDLLPHIFNLLQTIAYNLMTGQT